MGHKPVLLEEVIGFLNPESGKYFIDATADGGGHTEKILKKLPSDGLLVAVDQDEEMIERLKVKFEGEGRLKFLNGNFGDLYDLCRGYAKSYDGILFDLGFSSIQLEESKRGFSFQKDEPLLMTYKKNPEAGDLTAQEIVNKWSEADLREVIKKYGEERYARQIARAILRAREKFPIQTTRALSEIILKAVPRKYHFGRINPATRTFQALRIAVNDELNVLRSGLEGAWRLLGKKGRMAVISFNSLEDRIVKHYFRNLAKNEGAQILTKKPIVAEQKEVVLNPRARSAKLRVIEK